MFDVHWLSEQARSIHDLFLGVFYSLAVLLILIGVITEYFRLPLGAGADVSQLVIRAMVAAFLLQAYPEITNAISDVTDALAGRIGDFNSFHLVLAKMGDKLGEMTFSWTSVKDSLILAFSFVTFFILYISVYIADAGIVFVWTLLYIFSPLLLVLYILPVTAFATSALFRSLIEVSAWKIVWSVLATLLWTSALGNMNDAGSKLNFLTVISYNLILAISLLLTPLVVNAITSKGITQATSSWLGLAAGASVFNPGGIAKAVGTKAPSHAMAAARSSASKIRESFTNRKSSLNGRSSSHSRSNVPSSRRVSPMSESPSWVKSRAPGNKTKGPQR